MKKHLVKLFVAMIAVAVANDAYAVSAKSYIQDGLVFHLDAIANNGFNDNGSDNLKVSLLLRSGESVNVTVTG